MRAPLWLGRRVPVRLQLNTVECGAACLAMVVSYFGRHTTVAQSRALCGGGRGGVNALSVVDAARELGVEARGLRAVPGLCGQIELPAIAHWRGNHFVVVERWGPRKVDVVDPAWGRRRLPTAEFEENVSGTLLALRPGPEFVRAGRTEESTTRMLLRTMARVPGVRAIIAQVLLATVLLQGLGLAMPVATMLIVDEMISRNTRDQLVLILGIALGVTIAAQAIGGYLRSLLLIFLRGRLDWRMLTSFINHLYRLPLRYFHQRTTGDLAVRLASVGALRSLLAHQMVASTLDAALVLVYIVLMYVFDPVLATAVVVVLIAQLLLTGAVSGRVRDLMARNTASQVKVQEYLVQTLHGIGTIKAAGAERHVIRGLTDRVIGWTSTALRRSHLDAAVDTFSGMLRMLTPLMVLWVGVWRVLDGELTVGALLGFVWLSAAVLGPLSTLIANWQQLQGASIQLERLGDVLRAEPEPCGELTIDVRDRTRGAQLELRNVSFRYDADGPPAVDGITVTIRPGQRVAIVGRSGAGKTTLAMLLLGLYQPTGGEIRFDGIPLTELDLPALRARFGAVLQEPFTIRGTVRENIAFNHPEATDEDVHWAATVADVALEVSQLPLGYGTTLAERGVGLSGGQLQRLAIARALAGRPVLLILDEATSHLDAETERRIVANLQEVACTQVVIAHRLSTIRDADLILVMHDGQIVESGTHDELLAASGPYAALVAAQLSSGRRRDTAPEGNGQVPAAAGEVVCDAP